jgi:hypothetical protein
MFHGLDNSFLYTAYRIETEFQNCQGLTRVFFGTAFFLRNKNDHLCLITNRHVVDLQYRPEDPTKYIGYKLSKITIRGKGKDPSSQLPDLDLHAVVHHDKIIYSSDRENDVVCIVNPTGEDAFQVDYIIPYQFIATEEDFKTSLSVCDFVAFPGFPEWYDERGYRTILRTGTLASDPRYDYSSKKFLGAQVAYEAFSFGGSSGSPVFAVQKGLEPGEGILFSGFRRLLFIGINAGHLPYTEKYLGHSGVSYLYKSPAILEMIDRD